MNNVYKIVAMVFCLHVYSAIYVCSIETIKKEESLIWQDFSPEEFKDWFQSLGVFKKWWYQSWYNFDDSGFITAKFNIRNLDTKSEYVTHKDFAPNGANYLAKSWHTQCMKNSCSDYEKCIKAQSLTSKNWLQGIYRVLRHEEYFFAEKLLLWRKNNGSMQKE